MASKVYWLLPLLTPIASPLLIRPPHKMLFSMWNEVTPQLLFAYLALFFARGKSSWWAVTLCKILFPQKPCKSCRIRHANLIWRFILRLLSVLVQWVVTMSGVGRGWVAELVITRAVRRDGTRHRPTLPAIARHLHPLYCECPHMTDEKGEHRSESHSLQHLCKTRTICSWESRPILISTCKEKVRWIFHFWKGNKINHQDQSGNKVVLCKCSENDRWRCVFGNLPHYCCSHQQITSCDICVPMCQFQLLQVTHF